MVWIGLTDLPNAVGGLWPPGPPLATPLWNEGVNYAQADIFLNIKCIYACASLKIYFITWRVYKSSETWDFMIFWENLNNFRFQKGNVLIHRRYLFKNQPSIETFVTELKICSETCVVIVGCYKISEFEFQKYFHLVISGKQLRLIECY